MTDEESKTKRKLNKIAFEVERVIVNKNPDRYESTSDFKPTEDKDYSYLYDKLDDIHYRWYRQKKDIPKIGYKNIELDTFKKFMEHFNHDELMTVLNTIFLMDEFKDVLHELFVRASNDELINLIYSITKTSLTECDLCNYEDLLN